MSAPRIVFAVASGSYSDFGYHAIFEDRADAEAAIEADLGEHIHEIKLYPAKAALPRRMGFWEARMTIDARTAVRRYDQINTNYREAWDCEPSAPASGRPHVDQDREGDYVFITASAQTEQAAVVACSDRVAKVRAEILEHQS